MSVKLADRVSSTQGGHEDETFDDTPESELDRLDPPPDSYSITPFNDRTSIVLHAGSGGHGCISFLREKYIENGTFNGGDGGTGGSIHIQAVQGETSLLPPIAFNQEGIAILSAPDDVKSGSVAAQPPLEHDGFFSLPHPSSPPIAQSSLSSGYSATFLSSMFTPVDTTADPPVYTVKAFPEFLPATAMQIEASKHRVQRLASASFDVEVAASLPVIATPRCTPGATGSPARVTDSHKRNYSLRCSRTDVGDSEDLPSNRSFVADRTLNRRIHFMQELFGSDIVLVSSTVVDSASPFLEQTTISEEDAGRETEEEKAAPMTESSTSCIPSDTIKVLALVAVTFNAITDLYLTILPAVVVWNLQVMVKRARLGLFAALGLSFFATIASISKIYYVYALYAYTTTLHVIGRLIIVMAVEIDVVIIAASIPILAPLFLRNCSRNLIPNNPVLPAYEVQIVSAPRRNLLRLAKLFRRSPTGQTSVARHDSGLGFTSWRTDFDEDCVKGAHARSLEIVKTVVVAVDMAEQQQGATREEEIVPQSLHRSVSGEDSDITPSPQAWDELPTPLFLSEDDTSVFD
ncbi:hypothetical protein E4T45_01003 [Aureobasidium sp. EXF-8846]|nr:hypothetical protein E4T45_01003 [Aureobasidium sp. EXF-8846]